MSSTLSAMQIAYVNAYEGNATQAAIQAGYSASSARQSAARLMSKAAIRDLRQHTGRSLSRRHVDLP